MHKLIQNSDPQSFVAKSVVAMSKLIQGDSVKFYGLDTG